MLCDNYLDACKSLLKLSAAWAVLYANNMHEKHIYEARRRDDPTTS